MRERSEQSAVVADRSTGRGRVEQSEQSPPEGGLLLHDRSRPRRTRPTEYSSPTAQIALEADRGPAQSAQRDVLAARAEIAPHRVSESRPAPLTRNHVDSLRVTRGIPHVYADHVGTSLGVVA